jgi:post-segregation antitoxin (ccd killing protein)
MGRMTVSIPDELLERFRKQNPDINVAEVVRRGIIKRLEELEKFEKLKSKGVI